MRIIGAVVLCRYNSNRLPGKILKTINSKPILGYIIEKLLTVFERSNIVVATSIENTDEPIVQYCENNSIQYYRGSLKNVSQRFMKASLEYGFDYSVRINGDNLFIDLEIMHKMLHLIKENNYDFISNVKGRTFPKGMSIEIVSMDSYQNCIESFTTEAHYEHVTKYLYENEENLKTFYFYNERFPEAGGEQLAIDTEKDYEVAKQILERFSGNHIELGLEQVFKLKKELNEQS